MSSESTRHSAQDNLQFDRAVPTEAPNGRSDAGLTCAMCNAPLRTEYFHVAEQPTCLGAVAVYRALQPPAVDKPNAPVLATFLVLIAALTWLTKIPAVA